MEKHFLQTKHWAKVREIQGQKAIWIEDKLLLVKETPGPFKKFGYMPQVELVGMDWSQLSEQAQMQNLSHVLIDPSDRVGEYTISPETFTSYQITLAESVFYRDTLLIDLSKSLDQLQSEMHKKHRYNIRVATKHNVQVRITDTEEDFQIFLDLFFETTKRQKYFGRNRVYYQQIWSTLKRDKVVKIAVAEYEGKPLVAWMLFLGEEIIYYPYGGSSSKHRNVMAANGLVWDVLKWGKDQGYKYFDLWGIDPQDNSQPQKLHGFSDFKIKFGGEQIHYLPSYNLIIDPLYFSLFNMGNKLRWLMLKAMKSLRR